jgi:hypothetical protein
MKNLSDSSFAEDVSISQIETAINAWRDRSPAPIANDEPLVLCKEARSLADVYGRLIVKREQSVPIATLTAEQRTALLFGRVPLSDAQRSALQF